jgi:hypothetical protein
MPIDFASLKPGTRVRARNGDTGVFVHYQLDRHPDMMPVAVRFDGEQSLNWRDPTGHYYNNSRGNHPTHDFDVVEVITEAAGSPPVDRTVLCWLRGEKSPVFCWPDRSPGFWRVGLPPHTYHCVTAGEVEDWADIPENGSRGRSHDDDVVIPRDAYDRLLSGLDNVERHLDAIMGRVD